MNKPTSKVADNRPRPFFSVLVRLPKRPKNRNPVPPKAPECRTGYLDWDLYVKYTVADYRQFTVRLQLKLCYRVYCF